MRTPLLRLPTPSYANVASTLALFIALSGTSYAAVKLQKNSVGERELKTNAVTSAKIKNGSVTGADLAAGSIPTGPRGPRGAEGPRGSDGAPGAVPAAEPWSTLTLLNGWSDFSQVFNAPEEAPPAFHRDGLGTVHLRGVVTRTSGAPTQSTIARLPVGYRPTTRRHFAVTTSPGSARSGESRVDIQPTGEVYWFAGGYDPARVSDNFTTLDGIAFETN